MSTAHLKEYRHRLEKLLAALDDFEAADDFIHEDLAKLVGQIALLTEAVPLDRLLKGVKNQEMDPSSRDRLLDCLSKIARYRECARFLCRKAEKLPMLRNVEVLKVQYAARARDDAFPSPTTVDFERSLRRFQYGGKPLNISTLPGWLEQAAKTVRGSFPNDVNRIRREAKVHAEVQLLVHYDNAGDEVVPPRILASNKDACCLCHNLIRLHGRYQVPKSHGRLYRGWCMPVAYQGGPLQHALNAFLERQISATLRGLMTLPRRPLMIFPNESTIFPINLSASTLAGPSSPLLPSTLGFGVSALARAAAEEVITDSRTTQKMSESSCVQEPHVEEMEIHNVEDGVDVQGGIATQTSAGESDTESTYNTGDGGVDQATENNDGEDEMKDTTDGSLADEPQFMSERILQSGQTVHFQPVPASRTCFRTNRINMFIDEWSDHCSFKMLSGIEAEAVLRANTEAIVDVDSISPGVDVTLTKNAEGLTYIACGREVVMIHALNTPN